MRNSVLCRRMIVLTLSSILIAFIFQSVGYSQFINPDRLESNVVVIEPELSVNQIYDKAIRSVVWIVTPDGGQGSGVLIDKELRLAVTNAHVVDDHKSIIVFFPVSDKDGKLIDEREFYADDNNIGILERLGYVTVGRIIAKDSATDLAIVELTGLPETALEIEHDFSYSGHYYMNKNVPVHVLGNPGDLKLWRWTGGFFEAIVLQENGKEMLSISADTYKGNSGGPVLNERGMLIGIVSRSNLRTNTVAIPCDYVDDLLKTIGHRHIFSIQNDTSFTIKYQTQWDESDPWTETAVKPDTAMNHSYMGSLSEIAEGYPKIRFDYIANDGVSTYRYYKLETYQRRAGSEFVPSRERDAREYHFEYNYVTETLDLRDSESK